MIKNWDDETVNNIFAAYLDELSNEKRMLCERTYLSTKQKRDFLISEQKKFEKSIN